MSLYRQRVCHARGCWRRGRYEVEGTQFRVPQARSPRRTGATTTDRRGIAAGYHHARASLHRPHLHRPRDQA